jgi:hypothetical protein
MRTRAPTGKEEELDWVTVPQPSANMGAEKEMAG